MFIATLIAKFNAWMRYRDHLRELSELSDRELDDIGIARHDINRVARGAAGL